MSFPSGKHIPSLSAPFETKQRHPGFDGIMTTAAAIVGEYSQIQKIADIYNYSVIRENLHTDHPEMLIAMTFRDIQEFRQKAPWSRDLIPQDIRDKAKAIRPRHGYGTDFVLKEFIETHTILKDLPNNIAVLCSIVCPRAMGKYRNLDLCLFTEKTEAFDDYPDITNLNPVTVIKPWLETADKSTFSLINTLRRCLLEEIGLDLSPSVIGVNILSSSYQRAMRQENDLLDLPETVLIHTGTATSKCYIIVVDPEDLVAGFTSNPKTCLPIA